MTTTVVIANARGVFGDLLERMIEHQPRLELLARVDAPAAVRAIGAPADVIMGFSTDGSISAEVLHLLDEGFCATAVAVSFDGSRASLWQQGGTIQLIENPSPDELMVWIAKPHQETDDA